MFLTFRKWNYPFSSFCKVYSSCARRGVRFSTSNLGVPQQVFKGENGSYVTKDGVQFVIRSLTIADVPQLSSLERQMKNTIFESCLLSWLKKDPNGIKVAITGKNEIIGAISGVKNGDSDNDMCFGGLYFVIPEHQNKGIGRTLWKLNFEQMGTRNAGLNAVPGKLEIYRDTGGFQVHETRFTHIKYHTQSWPLDFTFLPKTPPPGLSICPFDSSHLPSIFAYDLDLIGFKRTSALALNLMEAGSRTLVALRSDGTCAGFGTMKVNGIGEVRVGPLYADGPEVADVLLRRLVEMVMHKQMEGFTFLTTSANRHAMEWMTRLGVEVYEVCDRLYTKNTLDVAVEKVYGQFDSNFAPF